MTSQQTTHSVPWNNVTDTDLLLVKLASFDLQRPTLTRTRSNLLLNFLFQGAHCKCLYLPNVCPPTATTSIDGLACMALRFNGNNYRQGSNFRPIKRRLGRKDGRELSSCKLQHSFRCEPVDVGRCLYRLCTTTIIIIILPCSAHTEAENSCCVQDVSLRWLVVFGEEVHRLHDLVLVRVALTLSMGTYTVEEEEQQATPNHSLAFALAMQLLDGHREDWETLVAGWRFLNYPQQ